MSAADPPAPAPRPQARTLRPPAVRWRAAARVGAPVLVGVVAFALAHLTLLPGLALWDTGEFQAVAPVLGTAHPTGYPSYILLGWVASLLLAPFGEPALRMNLLSAITLGATAGARNQFHQSLDKAVVDLSAFFKPRLTVLDAYRILVRNGPQGGRPSDTKLLKTVVAGVDGVAVEAVGATFFDIAPADLLYLKLAARRGLGRIDLEKLALEKRTV